MRKVNGARGIPRPLAAYRLGLLSRTFTLWRNFFLEWPDWESEHGVPFTIKQLNEAVLALAEAIPSNLYVELRAWLSDANNRWSSVLAMVQNHAAGQSTWDDRLVAAAAQQSNADLRSLVDAASAHLGELESAFRLGMHLGDYTVVVHSGDLRRKSPPGLDEIVAAAESLPRTLGSHLPVLKNLLAAASNPRSRGARKILTNALTRHAQDYRMYGADDDLFVVGKLIFALDTAIQEGVQESVLSKPKPSNVVQPPVDARPSWVKERSGAWVGELRIGDRVVRKLRAKAPNVIAVLDAFEEKGWPEAIDDPTSQNDSQRRHETLRSLNQGLTVIKFHGDGTNKGIKWNWVKRPRHLPGTSVSTPNQNLSSSCK
jgi:hypothetical protein